MCLFCYVIFLFFFNDPATTEIYTLSLHDALPICLRLVDDGRRAGGSGLAADEGAALGVTGVRPANRDRKSTRLNSSHSSISYAVFCLKKKKKKKKNQPKKKKKQTTNVRPYSLKVL